VLLGIVEYVAPLAERREVGTAVVRRIVGSVARRQDDAGEVDDAVERS